MILEPITLEQLRGLSVDEKVVRMDLYLEDVRRCRNPYYNRLYDTSSFIAPYAQTKLFQSHSNKNKLVWELFDLILQIEYVNSYFGFQNMLMSTHHINKKYTSSELLALNGQVQAVIVGSRIEFERLMRFIYFAFTLNEINGDSTFSVFKKWLVDKKPDDNLIYLMPFLKVARTHDKKFRTAEIHSGSKLKGRILALQEPEQDEQSEMLNLHNCVTNLLNHMKPLFDGERPFSASGSAGTIGNWLEPYAKVDVAKLTVLVEVWAGETT